MKAEINIDKNYFDIDGIFYVKYEKNRVTINDAIEYYSERELTKDDLKTIIKEFKKMLKLIEG